MKELVVPGEVVGIEEEMLPSEDTFSDNGEIVSAVVGEKKMKGRQVEILPEKHVRMVKASDVVYGRVMDVYDSAALIMIDVEPEKNGRKVVGASYAFLRVTEIARGKGYIKSMREFIRIGDYLKARIVEVSPTGTNITIADDDLGVVKSYCSICRSELHAQGRILVCGNCDNKESRKLAGAP